MALQQTGSNVTKGCHNCRIQKMLDEPFHDKTGAIEFIELLVFACVNCADNTARTEHNWEPREDSE